MRLFTIFFIILNEINPNLLKSITTFYEIKIWKNIQSLICKKDVLLTLKSIQRYATENNLPLYFNEKWKKIKELRPLIVSGPFSHVNIYTIQFTR